MDKKRSNSLLHPYRNENLLKCKRSQVTILIIIALIIVVGIIAVFLVFKGPGLKVDNTEDPKSFIRACVSDVLESEEQNIFNTNGYLSSIDNHIVYLGERVPYLCKASEFYAACVPQEPALIEKIRKQADINVKKDVENCFSALVNNLKKSGDVEEGSLIINFEIKQGKISLHMDKNIDFTKGDEKNFYDSFSADVPSPLYNLLATELAIINFESTYCEFNRLGWMNAYRDISIKLFRASDQTKVYTLIDKPSGKEIKFAVKTCLLPNGI